MAFLNHGGRLSLLPFRVSVQPLGAGRIVIPLSLRQCIAQTLQFERLLLVRQKHSRPTAADAWFVDVGEERAESIEIALLDGIKFMVVTLSATDGLAEPHGAHGAHTIGQHTGFVVFRLRAAFLRREDKPIERGGDFLFRRAVGQQVAGQLLARELVEGLVLVECLDYVVAIGPNVSRIVRMVARSEEQKSEIEPTYRHSLAKLRRCEELLYEPGYCSRRRVPLERLHVPGLGRQANQVEVKPARECAAIGSWR